MIRVMGIEKDLDSCCTRIKGNNRDFFSFMLVFVCGNDATFELYCIAWAFLRIKDAKEALMFLQIWLVDIVYRHARDSPCFCYVAASVR